MSILGPSKENINYLWLVLLILGNFFSGLAVFFLFSSSDFADQPSYLALVEGLMSYGEFSSYCNETGCLPETLRTPGYPLFLLAVLTIFEDIYLVQLIQLFLYFFCLFVASKIILKISSNYLPLYIFLLLTIFNIQIPYYAAMISTEMLSVTFVITFFYLYLFLKDNYLKYFYSAILLAGLFYIRPAFILFPVGFLFLSSFKFTKPVFKFNLFQLICFLVFLIPFGLWNLTNHNTFKLTTMEGGAGTAHMAYWSFKLPDNYTEEFYHGASVTKDIVNPFQFQYSDNKKEEYRLEYESEWRSFLENNSLNENCFFEGRGSLLKNKTNLAVCTSEFTLLREEFLWSRVLMHFYNEPVNYLLQRAYSFLRLFYTGIRYETYASSSNIKEKVMAIYPFAVTFTSIFIGLIFSIVVLFMNRKLRVVNNFIPMIFSILLIAASHSLFAIQSRYLVPMHLLVLISLSYSISLVIAKSEFFQNNFKIELE
ncbi:MAG: hypothetical protein CMD78_01215 [Gammaproteobacteria bacterium]|nr:hypothetical protein [Gammaproteobacteria bacterium]|tara:strand:+ start:215 stop:1660 length:1446 start_codon:yes stop_codon:yes gene_type:complete